MNTEVASVEKLRDETIALLNKFIENLNDDIEERKKWLESYANDNNIIKPIFTRIYTKRKYINIEASDHRMDQKANKTETTTKYNRLSAQRISALKQKKTEEIANSKEAILNAFEKDFKLKHNAISEEDKKLVYEDLEQLLRKNELKYLKELEEEIDKIIASNKSMSVRKKRHNNNKLAVIPSEVMIIKDENAKRYRELLKQLEIEKTRGIKIFEERVNSFKSKGYTESEIEQCREENIKQVKKQYDLQIGEFNKEASRRTRLAQAECFMKISTKLQQADELMKIYHQKIDELKTPTSSTIGWNKIMIYIDMTFEQTKSESNEWITIHQNDKYEMWNIFVNFLCDCWLSLGDVTRREEYNKIVYLYAVLYCEQEEILALAEPKETNHLRKIESLRFHRNDLMEQILKLDAIIKEKKRTLIKRSKPNKVKNKEEMRNQRINEYNSYIARVPSTKKMVINKMIADAHFEPSFSKII